MNYDQHEVDSDPGPIASQDWFVANLSRVMKIVPKEKLICAVGNYGYDWTLSIPAPQSTQATSCKAPGARYRGPLGLRRLAARSRCRRRPRPRLQLSQSPLRIHRRRQQPAPRGLVPRWRHAAQRDARRARAGPPDLCPVAAGLRGQLPMERVGQAQQPRIAAGAGLRATRPRRGRPRAKATSSASPDCPSPANAPSKWTPTSQTPAKSSSSMSTWISIRTPTPCSTTATIPTR